MRLLPAPEDAGIAIVRRIDGRRVEIPARPECVVSTERATALAQGGACAATVEHLLAALYGLGIDNLRAELDGPELPALDGSAAPKTPSCTSYPPEEKRVPVSVAEAAARAEPGEKPVGLFVREIKSVFTIASIDKAAGGGELRDADGRLHFVKARDPKVLDRLKVGDTVVVTYTEGLRLEVVAPGS